MPKNLERLLDVIVPLHLHKREPWNRISGKSQVLSSKGKGGNDVGSTGYRPLADIRTCLWRSKRGSPSDSRPCLLSGRGAASSADDPRIYGLSPGNGLQLHCLRDTFFLRTPRGHAERRGQILVLEILHRHRICFIRSGCRGEA